MSSVIRRSLTVVVLSLSFPIVASPRTWNVTGLSSGDAPTIQAAIDSSASGDTVLVGPGTYVENINLLGKNILLHSTSGPEVTTMDGSNVPPILPGLGESTVLFMSGESNACLLEGFTITGGTGHGRPGIGGGIYIYNASPTVRNNIIHGNQADSGGGMFIGGNNTWDDPSLVSPHVDGNTFTENTAAGGGGLVASFGNPVITNNLFLQNTASSGGGGGAYLGAQEGLPIVSHNTFRGNQAQIGGGLCISNGHGGTITVSFNLIVQNTATGYPNVGVGGGVSVTYLGTHILMVNNTIAQNLGGGLYFDELPGGEVARNIIAQNSGFAVDCYRAAPINVSFHDNLLWANSDGDFAGCGTWGTPSLIANPEFCGPASGDYSVSTTSPALGPGGPMGAFTEPGCGPVPTQKSTWGNLKTRAWRVHP